MLISRPLGVSWYYTPPPLSYLCIFQLYHLSKCILGSWLTERLLKMSVFGQFAGGLDERDAEASVLRLAEQKIFSIWFFSIERDIGLVNLCIQINHFCIYS